MKNRSAFLSRALLLLLVLVVYCTDAKMDLVIQKQDVLVGEELVLLCKAGGEGTIKWQKDWEDIDDEDKVKKMDESTSKLHIQKATLQDTGKYNCLCEFDSGHNDHVEAQVYVHEGPSFGETQTYHEFLEGTDGVVPCLVSGKPALDVRWLRNKQEIPTRDAARVRHNNDNTLRIEGVQRDDAGTYVCRAQIRGRPIHQELSVSVVVNTPPKVILREEVKKVMAGSETNVSLVCLVDGQPKPNITWTLPRTFDPSHHVFNSDRSQLTMWSVARADLGEYVCTATNKISEHSATITLHVFVSEAPEVFVSAEQQSVFVGESVSVSCNVSGHPQPTLHWLNKQNGQTLDSASGHIRVVDGVLEIDEIVPYDGGLYSCMAVSTSGNASRDVAIHTQPGPLLYLSASPGPSSVLFSLKTMPISGGTPVTSFVLQWRQSATEKWNELAVPASDPLAITALKPYALYTVRLAALNAVGLGQFSETKSVRTLGIREPDSPVLLNNAIKIESNSFTVPLKPTVDGGTPLLHFRIRYRQDKEEAEWKEMQLPSEANAVSVEDLSFGSDYQMEVMAVNANGSSMPSTLNFTIAEKPQAPEVFVSAEQQSVFVGESVSVSCNVSGHPQPTLHWLNKQNGQTLDSASGHIRVVDGVLEIDEIVPSDGGLYSCMAVSTSGNATRDVAIHTQPGLPLYLSASPGPSSVLFSLKTMPISGGTPVTSFVLQWRQSATETWNELTVPASDPLAITALKPYALYTVRLAALNAVGLGQFSETKSVRTLGIREPDSPVLLNNAIKIESNSLTVPLKQTVDGGTPLLHFRIRYRQDKEEAEWKEMQLPSEANAVSLEDLSFGSDYRMEVMAVNANGSSMPSTLNFTIAEKPQSSSMTKGRVVGIVIVIFLVVFLVVDATCCYRNRCGLLMSIAVKLFGQKVPGLKGLDDGTANGDVKLNGISTLRDSMQQLGVQTSTKEGGQLTEVTCDKAPLTKNEKTQPDRSQPNAEA